MDKKLPGTNISVNTIAQANDDPGRRFVKIVAATAATLAAMAAVSGSLSASHLNQAMLEQIQASDQWNFFQAKGIKRGLLVSKLDVAAMLAKPAAQRDTDDVERYQREQDEIRVKAEDHTKAAEVHRRQHAKLGYAATISQIAIALTAVALLTRGWWAWVLALIGGAASGVFITLGLLAM